MHLASILLVVVRRSAGSKITRTNLHPPRCDQFHPPLSSRVPPTREKPVLNSSCNSTAIQCMAAAKVSVMVQLCSVLLHPVNALHPSTGGDSRYKTKLAHREDTILVFTVMRSRHQYLATVSGETVSQFVFFSKLL